MREGAPFEDLGRQVHHEGEVGERSGSGSTSTPAHEVERGVDTERTSFVGLEQEFALRTAVSRRSLEEVRDALFNGRITDVLLRVSGVIADALRAGNTSGGQVFSNTSGNDTSAVGEGVGEETLDASQRGVLEGAGGVGFAFASNGQTSLLVRSGGESGLALVTDVVGEVVVDATGDTAVASEREGNPVELAVLTGLVVGTVDNAVSDVLHFPALVINENKSVSNEVTRTTVVMGSTAAGNSNARLGGVTPRLAGGADALKGLTVVVSGGGTVSRNIVAGSGQRAQSGSGPKRETVSARIIGSAAAGNNNASFLSNTPSLTSRASALNGLTVVVGRAVSGNVIASIGQRAPAGSRSESRANSTVVVS